jgi:hypothetical protein
MIVFLMGAIQQLMLSKSDVRGIEFLTKLALIHI